MAAVAVAAVFLLLSLAMVVGAPPTLEIESPLPDEALENPARVVLLGPPQGAEVGVRLVDALGRTLVEKVLVFRRGRAEGSLYFDLPTGGEGSLEVFLLATGRMVATRKVRLTGERGKWVKVFFFDREGKLFPAVRRIPETPKVATEALRALLSGPTLPEARDGIWSAAPEGARLLSVSLSGVTASATFAVPDPQSPSLDLFSLQVQQTLLQFPTIEAVEVQYIRR